MTNPCSGLNTMLLSRLGRPYRPLKADGQIAGVEERLGKLVMQARPFLLHIPGRLPVENEKGRAEALPSLFRDRNRSPLGGDARKQVEHCLVAHVLAQGDRVILLAALQIDGHLIEILHFV